MDAGVKPWNSGVLRNHSALRSVAVCVIAFLLSGRRTEITGCAQRNKTASQATNQSTREAACVCICRRRRYTPLAMRRERRIAKVAMARKLAVSLYWMLRTQRDYQQTMKFGSHAGESDYVHGVQ
jgi:hypothetical protein